MNPSQAGTMMQVLQLRELTIPTGSLRLYLARNGERKFYSATKDALWGIWMIMDLMWVVERLISIRTSQEQLALAEWAQ